MNIAENKQAIESKEVIIPQVFCDLNTKPYLNEKEAIVYMGYGSKDTLRRLRESGKLAYIKPAKNILYKRTDINRFLESNYIPAFN